MQVEDAKSIKRFFRAWLTPNQIDHLPSNLHTMTIYQLSFQQILEKEVSKVFVETNINTGKSTALIFHMIIETLKYPASAKLTPITLCLFPHKTFVQKFKKKLRLFTPLLNQIGCEIFTADDADSNFLTAPKRRIFVGTFGENIKQFQEEKISLAEIDSIIINDLDYLTSFSQTHNFWRLFDFFKMKQKSFLSSSRLIMITNDDTLEEVEKIKTGFDFEFTVLKVKKEAPVTPEKTEVAKTKKDKKSVQSASVLKAIFNQYFYIGSKSQTFSMLYILLKFELFPEGSLIITDSINAAYLMATFVERVQLGSSQVYNPQHPISLRAYNVALFNAKQSRILVGTKAFLEDLKANKAKVSAIRGIKNLIFHNCNCDYATYGSYLELLQGESNYLTADGHFDLNILFLVEKAAKLSAADDHDDEDQESTYVQSFNDLLTSQEQIFNKILFEPIFVEEKDVNLFTYRIDTVLQSLTPKQIKILRSIEINKIILKSKKMKEYFSTHQNERELLLSKLGKLSQAAKKNEVKIPSEVPDYLLPSFMKNSGTRKAQAVLAKREANLAKKKMDAGDDAMEVEGEAGEAEKGKKKEPKKFSEIVRSNETPETMDPKSLKTFSSHKLWKIRHHKIHKKDDKKLIRKGIYKA